MTVTIAAFGDLPPGLRDPLLREYQTLIQNYLEGRWSPAEVSGGRFCEIVYTIIDGFSSGTYAAKPAKPKDMVSACRALEQRSGMPRGFQILIPRLLPGLYEVRNNRGAGHAGGDVDPNHMDSTAVLAVANWVMAELVRVLHKLPSPKDAQIIVDGLAVRRIPLVWEEGGMRRVLDRELSLNDQILLLAASCAREVSVTDLVKWTDSKNRTYFLKLLRKLHQNRLVNLSTGEKSLMVLPPGMVQVEKIVRDYHDKQSR